MRRLGLAGLFLALVVSQALAQGDGVPDYVSVTARADRSSYAPGDVAKLTIDLKIDPTVHVNAHVPTADYQYPTDITWEQPPGLAVGNIEWPKPLMKAFEFTDGEKIAVLEGSAKIVVPIAIPANAAAGPMIIAGTLGAQGCTHTTCYAPQQDPFTVQLTIGAAGAAAPSAAPTTPPAQAAAGGQTAPAAEGAETTPAEVAGTTPPGQSGETEPAAAGGGETASVPAAAATTAPAGEGEAKAFDCPVTKAEGVKGKPMWLVFAFAYMGGLLLTFTPCVLPLVPITIGIFARQQGTGGKPVVPALMYVLGLALTYAVLGTFAALTGNLFGAALQNPWVLVGISALLFALGLSMFGLWNFDLPAGLRNRVGGFKSGPIGPMLMGGAMGIVAAPCVGPFVVSLLTYVADLGARLPGAQAALIGGALFFVLATGLGTPFFLVALGAGSLKPGEWMDTVKRVFGFVIMGVVLWFLRPLIKGLHPEAFLIGLVIVLVAACAYFLITAKGPAHGPRLRAAHGVLGVLAAAGALVLGALVLRAAGSAEASEDGFIAYSDAAVEQAKTAGQPVVIDFGAEWCAACKELEHQTFPHRDVRKAGEPFILLRADLTNDRDPAVQALRKKYSVGGLPTVLFLDGSGREIDGLRLTGFEGPEEFVTRLKCATSVNVAERM